VSSWSSCVIPPRLKGGDKVAVVAPSGPVPEDGLRAGMAILAERYVVQWDDALLTKTGYLAGDDDRRANELNHALADPDVRAVIVARGGYGITRILDRLDADALRRDPKIIVGFSDVTALLSWCVVSAGVRPVHGPVVVQLGKLPAEDAAWLTRLLEDPSAPGPIPTPAPLTRTGVPSGGTLEGRVVGGNLEMVTRLLGTPWAIDLGASIFFCEDVGERPYRVDRMLTQLKLAGALDGVRAVAVGDFTNCEDKEGPTAEQVIAERLTTFELPAVRGLPVGHGARNMALPIGAKCVLDLGRGQLVLEESAVG
jgi:muramoyltetrapeptide carboxypeptidase